MLLGEINKPNYVLRIMKNSVIDVSAMDEHLRTKSHYQFQSVTEGEKLGKLMMMFAEFREFLPNTSMQNRSSIEYYVRYSIKRSGIIYKNWITQDMPIPGEAEEIKNIQITDRMTVTFPEFSDYERILEFDCRRMLDAVFADLSKYN